MKAIVPLMIVSGVVLILYMKFVMEDANIVTYFRINDQLDYSKPSLTASQTMLDVFHNKIVKATAYRDTKLLFFETLNTVDDIIKLVRTPISMTHINGIAGTDFLVSKANLCFILRRHFPESVYNRIIPKTFVLTLPKDVQSLLYDLESGNRVYIAKKNVQRQQGVVLTRDTREIIEIINSIKENESKSDDYVVVQHVLQNPLLVNRRKINLRVYMLVIVENDQCKFYMGQDGFIYYTPDFFEQYSVDHKRIITTGYIDRQVYEENPLTHKDLQKHMGDGDYSIMMDNVEEVLRRIKSAFTPIFLEHNRFIPGCKFLIYGCDIAPASDLTATVMEINKGPDMSYKDERDKAVKLELVREAFGIVNFMDVSDSGLWKRV